MIGILLFGLRAVVKTVRMCFAESLDSGEGGSEKACLKFNRKKNIMKKPTFVLYI